MKLDVLFSPLGLTPAEVQGRTVFVVDILRLSTTVCAALHHGARAVVPVPSTEEALRMAQTLGPGEVVLAGERNGLPIPGFALGNSPREMTPDSGEGTSRNHHDDERHRSTAGGTGRGPGLLRRRGELLARGRGRPGDLGPGSRYGHPLCRPGSPVLA